MTKLSGIFLCLFFASSDLMAGGFAATAGYSGHTNRVSSYGEFAHTIPNFKGIAQEQNLWCWDAAVATLIRSATGATVDQAKLAALHFTYPKIVSSYFDRIAWIDSEDCHGLAATTSRCNHRGNSASALAYLGKAFPWEKMPSSEDSSAVLQRVRES